MKRRSTRVMGSVIVGSSLSLGCGADSASSRGDPSSATTPPGGATDNGEGGGTGFASPGGSAGIFQPGPGPASGSGGAASYPGSAGASATTPPPVGSVASDAGVAPALPSTPAIVNPFTLTAHDPLSTFAADVDTASYDGFVRDIGAGRLPVTSTVRTEDFVNFFRYDYPAPLAAGKDPFSISLAAAPGVFGDGTTTLRVGIQGRPRSPSEAKPANLVFLIDVSGSMESSEKLPLVKLIVKHALDVLSPTDTVSVVTYASGTEVALAPTPAGNKTAIDAVVDELAASGSTNGAGGIQLAYDQAQAAFLDGGVNDVILCTDGDFNVGISDTAGLVQFISDRRATGVTLTALGFGAAPHDSMMEAVSNAGNGVYSVITSPPQAKDFVETRLLSDLHYIAQDVKLQVEFNPAEVYAYRLMGYEDRAIPDAQFRNDMVDAGEIGMGHRVTALYQLVLTGGTIPDAQGAAPVQDGAAFAGRQEVGPGDAVLVKVRYKTVGSAATDPAFEVAAPLSMSALHGDIAGTDPDLRWAVSVAAFAEILRGSPYANPAGLDTISTLVTESAGADPDKAAFVGYLGTARGLLGN